MRDCALRGITCILLEKDDIASGTTGRNHGLLHSGARYAVTDAESAKECIQENQTLKHIARHCVEATDGLFITLPEDELSFQDTFIQACGHAGIETTRLTPKEALALEPNVNPALIGAVKVQTARWTHFACVPLTCWMQKNMARACLTAPSLPV